VEAVFQPENFRIFSDDFRAVPAGKHGKLTGIHWKKSGKFPFGILLPLPAISVAFLQDPAGSSGRNLRHGILDLKTQNNDLKKALKRAQDGSDASVSSGKKTKRNIYVHILYFRKWYLIELTTTSKYRL
jgi:hypothetical protein